MERTSILYTLVIAAGIGAICMRHVDDRLERLEQAPRVAREELVVVATTLDALCARVEQSRLSLAELALTCEQQAQLAPRIAALEEELHNTALTIGEQRARLASYEFQQHETPHKLATLVGSRLECRVEELEAEIDERYRHISDLARRTSAQVQVVEENLTRDEDRMWRELVGPVVQLSGDETVGSGVLLESQALEGGRWRTCLLTAWHVVRDIVQEGDPRTSPIPVTIYGLDRSERSLRHETAYILAHNVSIDAALLVLESERPVACGAKLASLERLAKARIFDQVYAVGCPLGNDPIPTFGEIADTNHQVEDLSYWMISAPTYIGNSGGGIFDADSHELLGIFSKIYTHGALRPTVVPHMGLVVPLGAIYSWLEQTNQLSLLEAHERVAPRTAAAEKH